MTAAELAAFLATVPPETPVVVSGYEMGLTAVLAPLRVGLVVAAPFHDDYSGELHEGRAGQGVAAVFIERAGGT